MHAAGLISIGAEIEHIRCLKRVIAYYSFSKSLTISNYLLHLLASIYAIHILNTAL